MSEKRSFRQAARDAAALILRDIRDARWAIIIVIAYFAFQQLFLGRICPVVLLSGFPCPACGLTRAGVLVLRLRFAEAFGMHPFIYPIILIFIFFCIQRYVMRKKKMEVLKWCAVALIAFMTAFYVYRMYRYFPGNPPMNYCDQNVLSWFFSCVS